MTHKKAVEYWLNRAQNNFEIAQKLFKFKHYDWSLFFCHLVLEKLLKGLIVKKTKQSPLPVHNLVKLATLTDLKLTDKAKLDLREISTFNVQARYDDIKLSFYKKATKKFAEKYFQKTREYCQWLKSFY